MKNAVAIVLLVRDGGAGFDENEGGGWKDPREDS